MLYNAVDYFNIEELLSEEEKLIMYSVREFVENEVIPIIGEHYLNATFPMELIPKMSELGLLGITLPTELGGAGANYTSYGLAMMELERGDSAIRSFASVQNSLVIYPIYTYGTEVQKKKWLPKLASGEVIGCFGLTEPDYGSNPSGMLTNAKKIDGGYLLNGAKMWITNGTLADVAVVWAKLDGVIHGFLVEKGTKGFSAPEMKGKLSLRASVTSELIFEDCEIPDENLINIKGLKGPLSCLTQARFGISWGAVGAAMAVYDSSVQYAKSRIQFGKPIASFQLVQEKLVWMLNEITKAQLIAYRLGRLKDEGKDRFQQTSLAKRNNVDMALTACRVAREIHGANGILYEYHIMRHAANLESVKTYEGTDDIHTLILGEDITGIPAFE
ncbi:MAG: acyl-CoA dehydrogenase [Ignavibacteria bacterium GWB2_35_12]|nr:MAG: acyl-CoA dehydrogenase [Ignavibacteria bacterium GWA2_35_8]OGU42256.1 MAG: acyl-CoA dehydrogenase [Ignavibacteria bacterium GWB2_35_12]OGU93521.1 MAG: acyl-CoA dehydrogenase [Ignavibacteria bacterium RIFOXYA2_FULL_35_10]OGV22169.1 MAG: acyl-CoA dehydrogenase [Ignavibacteria bacterium RIFOXYC2_FULL_35_21]